MTKPTLINKNGPKTIEDFIQAKGTSIEQESMLKSLFKEKAPNYTEIEVSFFQLCALHCSFCWQDTYDATGITSIRSKTDTVIEYLKSHKEQLRPNIQIHLLGGELFEDNNNYYEDYYYFINKIKEYCDQNIPEKNLIFIFLTNMNFQKETTKEKLEYFLNRLKKDNCHFFLTTSWDPTGRPLKGEVTTKFHQNITYFKSYISEITFVLTKPTIKRILQGRIPYLDLLTQEGFTIDFDYYMPTTNVDKLMPSDRELYNTFSALLKNYPQIKKLSPWKEIHDTPTKITCASLNKITILPDGTITNCRHLNYNQTDFSTRIKNESNSDMIMNYITSKECLSCEYFSRCPFSCFLMSDHKQFLNQKDLDECFYKLLFRDNDGLETRN